MKEIICHDEIADDVECDNLADYLLSELESFYSPILDENARDRRVMLFRKWYRDSTVTEASKIENPKAELILNFRLSKKSLAIDFRDITTEQRQASLNRRLRHPGNPRRDVAAAAWELQRQVIRDIYGVDLGQQASIYLQLPARSDLEFSEEYQRRGRWRFVRATQREGESFLRATRAGTQVMVTSDGVNRQKRFREWKIINEDTNPRMRPVRTAVLASGGVSFFEEGTFLTSDLRLRLLFSPQWSVHAGIAYYVTPRSTQTEPIPGNPATTLAWSEGVVTPYLGLGGHFVSEPLGIRYGIGLSGFFSPRLYQAETWVAADRFPGLRLRFNYQQLTMDVEERTFSRTGSAAATGTTPRTYAFPSVSLAFYQPF